MNLTIADQVEAMAQAAAAQPANPAMAVFAAEQARLASADIPGVIEPGTTVKDSELLDPNGQATTLYQAIGESPAVLVFYRGDWCPYCNIALRTYQAQVLPELRQHGVALVAVSPQKPDASLSLVEKAELAFTVLSDPGLALADQLGIVITPAPEVVAAQRELGLDITASNADGTTALPMPTVVVLDRDRVVRWVDVHPNYATRSEPADILAAVHALGA